MGQPHILCKRGESMKGKDELIKIFSIRLRGILQRMDVDLEQLQEIRLIENILKIGRAHV